VADEARWYDAGRRKRHDQWRARSWRRRLRGRRAWPPSCPVPPPPDRRQQPL